VTRSKLIDLLTQRFPQYSRQDVDVSVKEIINGLSDAMKEGRRIEIRWFGSFYLKYRKERTGRNPRTGESVQIPGKKVLNFKASKELRLCVKEINQSESPRLY
jgi:integration host factor subunit beta